MTSVRGRGSAPTIAASARLGAIGFMNAALGVRGRRGAARVGDGDGFLASFFIGFLTGFLAASFFVACFAANLAGFLGDFLGDFFVAILRGIGG